MHKHVCYICDKEFVCQIVYRKGESVWCLIKDEVICLNCLSNYKWSDLCEKLQEKKDEEGFVKWVNL